MVSKDILHRLVTHHNKDTSKVTLSKATSRAIHSKATRSKATLSSSMDLVISRDINSKEAGWEEVVGWAGA